MQVPSRVAVVVEICSGRLPCENTTWWTAGDSRFLPELPHSPGWLARKALPKTEKRRDNKNENFFAFSLANRGGRCTMNLVPLNDDFGDWATPKKPTAGHFLRPPPCTSLSPPSTRKPLVAIGYAGAATLPLEKPLSAGAV
jgi:hypothetical protein